MHDGKHASLIFLSTQYMRELWGGGGEVHHRRQ